MKLNAALRKKGPPFPFKPQDYEVAFVQCNRSLTGFVTDAELYCHVVVECGQPAENAAGLMLSMDLDGDGRLGPDEGKVGYKRFAVPFGLRPKDRLGETYNYDRTKADIEPYAAQLASAMKPKLDLLELVFKAIDLNKDGKVSAIELRAFQEVITRRVNAELAAEQEAAYALLLEENPKAPPPIPNQPPLRTQAFLSLDMDEALQYLCEEQQASELPRDEWGEVALPFERFRAYLARHPQALEPVAAAGAGKKGKKKK